MADHMSGGPQGEDPLGDRLRATFTAERVDIERRHLAHDVSSTRSRPLMWIPFAAAAAVIAVAGFLFIGNRTDDTAVDLDVAAQTGQTEWEVPQPEVAEPVAEPTSVGLPSVAVLPATGPDGAPLSVPHIPGDNMCGDLYDPSLVVAWAPDSDTIPAQSDPEPSGEHFISRQIPVGTVVTHAVGCTAGTTQFGPAMWFEIEAAADAPADWVNVEYLISLTAYQEWVSDGTTPPAAPSPQDGPVPVPVPIDAGPNECGEQPFIFPVQFISGIEADDPDGGLVAHTAAGIDEPVTRIIQLDEVVDATGACELSPTGTPWIELRSRTGGVEDWVSGRYLAEPIPACLRGEQYGTRSRDDTRLIYNVLPGDTIGAIAAGYGIALEELLAANPSVDPATLRVDQAIWIPGAVPQAEQIFGPIDGLAVIDGDRIAFAPQGETRFRWYAADAVELNLACFDLTQSGPVCLLGTITLIDFDSPEPIWTGVGPRTVERTGRTITTGVGYVEVGLTTDTGDLFIGFVNPSQVVIVDGECAPTQATDSFAAAPCNATDSDVVTGSTVRGSVESDADHVLNLRAEEGASVNGVCTRIVIEFGVGSDTGGPDRRAALLPEIGIVKQPESTRIVLPAWTNSAGVGKPTRLDARGNIVLVTGSGVSNPAIEILHEHPAPVNVWFLENPARVIVDYLNPPPSTNYLGSFGDEFVLRAPIQLDQYGPGILQGQEVVVRGFGRPFEAQGSFRVYDIEPDTDIASFLLSNPDPLFSSGLRTSSWIDGWGEFEVQLPSLEPGTYVAVFGETPPTDIVEFVGVGQVFRVYDPATPRESTYPVAELLPSVRIPG